MARPAKEKISLDHLFGPVRLDDPEDYEDMWAAPTFDGSFQADTTNYAAPRAQSSKPTSTFAPPTPPIPQQTPADLDAANGGGMPDAEPQQNLGLAKALVAEDPNSKGYDAITNQIAYGKGLMSQADQVMTPGSGWVGALRSLGDKLGGAWLQRSGMDEKAASDKEIDDKIAAARMGGGSDAMTKYIDVLLSSPRAEDREAAKKLQIAQMEAAQKASYKDPMIEDFKVNGNVEKRISYDQGKSWKTLSSSPLKAEGSGSSRLDPQTLDTLAEQYLVSGNSKLFMRLSGDDVAELRNVIATKMKENGYTARQVEAAQAEFKALQTGLSSLATRQTNIDTAVAEARDMSVEALKASNKVPRGKFVPLNKLYNNWEVLNSNPDLAEFEFYATSVAGAMATVAGRGTTNQHLQEKFMHMLGTATSKEAFARQMRAVEIEAHTIMKSTESVRDRMVHDYTRGAGSLGAVHEPAGAAPAGAAPPAAPPVERKQIIDPKSGKPVWVKKVPDGWDYE